MKNLVPGLLLLILGTGVWVYAGTFPALPEGHPGPALFPRLIAAGMMLTGVLLAGDHLLQSLKGRRERMDREGIHGPGALRFGIGIVLTSLFPFMQDWFGAIVAQAILIFGVALMLRTRPLIAGATAIASAAIIYLLFSYALGVPL